MIKKRELKIYLRYIKGKMKFFLFYFYNVMIGLRSSWCIGTHYCRPGLKYASETFEQYCPKRLEGDNNYIPIDGQKNIPNDTNNVETNKKEMDKEKAADEKVKEKAIELTSALKKWF